MTAYEWCAYHSFRERFAMPLPLPLLSGLLVTTMQVVKMTVVIGCCLTANVGCAGRTEGPVLLTGKIYESHNRVIDIRQTPHDEARAIALISKKTMSPPGDLAGFIADAQRFGRRLGADDCAIEVVSDPLGGFVMHGYLQVGRWRDLTDAVKPARFEKIFEKVMKSIDQ